MAHRQAFYKVSGFFARGLASDLEAYLRSTRENPQGFCARGRSWTYRIAIPTEVNLTSRALTSNLRTRLWQLAFRQEPSQSHRAEFHTPQAVTCPTISASVPYLNFRTLQVTEVRKQQELVIQKVTPDKHSRRAAPRNKWGGQFGPPAKRLHSPHARIDLHEGTRAQQRVERVILRPT